MIESFANPLTGQQCIEDTIRIVGGPNGFEGRVEICIGGVWGQVCGGTGWDSVDAQVVCRQLGYSSTFSKIFFQDNDKSCGNCYDHNLFR